MASDCRAACGSASAQAAAIQLQQHGWDQGGPLTISFSGTDLDSSGAIEQQELGTFQAEFVLPLGSTTVWMIADIQPDGFVFGNANDFLLSLWNGEYLLNDEAFGGQTLGSVADMFLFLVAATGADATVVPEASAATLTAFGIAAITYLVRPALNNLIPAEKVVVKCRFWVERESGEWAENARGDDCELPDRGR